MKKSDLFPAASEEFRRLNASKLATFGQGKKHRRGGGGGHRPNKTEREFNRLFLGGDGMYEGITFRLPGGSRYTPDWVLCDHGRLMVAEVKGSYRFPSEGRALTAYKEAKAAFPAVVFSWWIREGEGVWRNKETGEVVDFVHGLHPLTFVD